MVGVWNGGQNEPMQCDAELKPMVCLVSPLEVCFCQDLSFSLSPDRFFSLSPLRIGINERARMKGCVCGVSHNVVNNHRPFSLVMLEV